MDYRIKSEYQEGAFIVPKTCERMVLINRKYAHQPFHIGLTSDGKVIATFSKMDKEDNLFRPATPLEIKCLLQALLNEGYIWDFTVKTLRCVDEL